jgi:hypothetical protein
MLIHIYDTQLYPLLSLKVNNVRKHRRGNQGHTIQRNWQHRVHKTKKNNTICVGHRYTETNARPENQSKTQHKERLLSPVFPSGDHDYVITVN